MGTYRFQRAVSARDLFIGISRLRIWGVRVQVWFL